MAFSKFHHSNSIIIQLYKMRHYNSSSSSIATKYTNYKQAIETLNSLQTNAQVLQKSRLNQSLGQENNVENTKLFLIRTGVTLDRLDKELSVIHVSGTKGKGSTCALCESILHSHGYKTGFFSSPHLVAVRERLRINKTPLEETEFARYFWIVYDKLYQTMANKNDMPSYFKFLTVMALNVFLAEKVDVAIIEVGIGGEYDCTNIFGLPVVVGITSLGLDHTSLLGNTIEQIAWQKGGIMKPGAAVFTSPQPAAALNVLRQRALERNCCLWEAPPLSDYDWHGNPVDVGLSGSVQTINASLALQLSRAWIRRSHLDKSRHGFLGYAKSFSVDPAYADGLKSCFWPGRYQIIRKKSINGLCTYYLDGAHTLDSIELCVQWFKKVSNYKELRCNKQIRYLLIFNVTGDRAPEDLMTPLVYCGFDGVFFTPNLQINSSFKSDLKNYSVTTDQQHERCQINKRVWQLLEKQNRVLAAESMTLGSVNETVKAVEQGWTGGEQHILVTGSLHLVGAMLSVIDPQLKSFNKSSSAVVDL